MPTPYEIVSQMRQSLSVSEPDLDTSVGTPIRKILDVVSEAVAEAYIDRYLLSYQYDIDAKAGADLDAFVSLFGFTRQAARRATGTVLLLRDSPASSAFFVPNGSQFSTGDSTSVTAQTVTSTIFPQGSTSISVTVQAAVGGSAGNVAANSLTRWISPIPGIIAITNPAALTGGMDAESDDQLRERFKRSLFRNMAGTEDMYLGLANDNSSVNQAIVLGPSERWREQIEVISGSAVSTISNNIASLSVTAATNASPSVVTVNKIHNLFPNDIVKISGVTGNTAINGTFRIRTTPSTTTFTLTTLDGVSQVNGNGAYVSGGSLTVVSRCKWVFPTGYAFGANLNNGEILTPNVHYAFDTTTIPPTVTSLDSVNCPDGIYDLSFNYSPISSRNDVPQGISNRVDVYLDGSEVFAASETMICDGRVVVSATPGGTTGYNRFRRADGNWPTANNVLSRLTFVPVIDLPDSFTIGSQTLVNGVDYWLVSEIGIGAGAWDAYDAIEISASSIQTGTVSISSSTNATPIVLTTSTTHNFKVGQRVYVVGHTVNTAANGYFEVLAAGASTITLKDSVGNGVGGATGTVALVSPVSISYDYNSAPRSVQSAIEDWRLLTTDVVAHYGTPVSVKINAAVILKAGYTTTSVQSAMSYSVSSYLASIPFGGTLQISDLLNVMGDVGGIDAVRMLNSSDRTSIAVSGASNASPIVLTVASGHGIVANDSIVVSGIIGNTAANGTWTVSSVGSTTITLKNSVGNGAYSSGGTAFKANIGIQRMEKDGVTPNTVYLTSSSPYRAVDIQAADNEFFSLHSVSLTVKAINSWGTY